jgi:hypothetical protein
LPNKRRGRINENNVMSCMTLVYFYGFPHAKKKKKKKTDKKNIWKKKKEKKKHDEITKKKNKKVPHLFSVLS